MTDNKEHSTYIDKLTAIPSNKIQETRKSFNSLNSNLQFTIEAEKQNRMAYLDLMIIRKERGNILTDWYHKQTCSGRYISFKSNLPFSYEHNTIKILTDKITKLSDPEFYEKKF